MWHDNETNRDFVNFRSVADTAAEIIRTAGSEPVSLGICGGWGVGKSSMVSLLKQSLEEDSKPFIFVEFNAWLFQGFDDARASFMETIATRLIEAAEGNETALDKAGQFLRRVNWVRAAGMFAGSAISMSMGLPPVGIIKEIYDIGKGLSDGEITGDEIESASKTAGAVGEKASGLMKPKATKTPPEEIHALRRLFQETIESLDVKLVVLVDDLDRCLPNVAISTLEAMRLFLFIPNTAFVVAADDAMLKQSVRAHFGDLKLDDDLVTNYFDKLIQIPIRVPPLGTQEVRAFLLLLFIENSELKAEKKEEIRSAVCEKLGQSWKGERVDTAFVKSLISECPDELSIQLEMAMRLAPIMTTSEKIRGNPRLIKRFLNTLSIRAALARKQGVTIDETALAKLLLFERCGNEKAYAQLVQAVNESDDGKPHFLKDLELAVQNGEELIDDSQRWTDEFSKEWLSLSPQFHEFDLRASVYASRDHLPIISKIDRLSPEANDLLNGVLSLTGKQPNRSLSEAITDLGDRDVSVIMEKVLEMARREQKWGTPGVLYQLLTVAAADPKQETKFSNFLIGLDGSQITAPCVMAISNMKCSVKVYASWSKKQGLAKSVKNAISDELKNP